MTFALNLLAAGDAGVDWSRPLMIGWIIVVLALSVIEVWLMGGFSSRRVSGVNARRGEESMN